MVSTAVDVSAVARVVGIKTEFVDLRAGSVLFLPQRIAVMGQGASASVYSTTKAQLTSSGAVGERYGFGPPLHLAARQLFPTNGDGVGTIPVTFYPLLDDPSGVASSGSITPSGAQTESATYRVLVSNILSAQFTIPIAATVSAITAAITAAINAVPEMPVLASDNGAAVSLTSKWEGASANDIYVEISGSTTAGTVFAIVQPTGGAANPSIAGAIAQIGDVWETLVLNCLNYNDTTTLDSLATENEGRWGPLRRRPFVAFAGVTEADMTTATAVANARPTDRTNSHVTAPGSNELPLVVAARWLARVAPVANNNPPRDYGSQQLTGLTPGTDAQQWDYPTRDAAVKRGGSTSIVRDGVINISDTITFYKPSTEPIPAYRFVTDIIKIQNLIFNVDLIFNTPAWDGAPLLPDRDPTFNPSARKPKSAVAAVNGLIDSLGLNAIISDPATAKTRTQAAIDGQNPKRLNVAITVQLVGNANILSIDLDFGFFFGTAPIVI